MLQPEKWEDWDSELKELKEWTKWFDSESLAPEKNGTSEILESDILEFLVARTSNRILKEPETYDFQCLGAIDPNVDGCGVLEEPAQE